MLSSLELYEKVDNLRRQKRMSVAELNRRAGISHATLPSWKQRKTMPTLELLEAICDALDVSLATLLYDADADNLSGEEMALLNDWRALSSEQKVAIITLIKAINKTNG